jgi:amino acid transporter
MHTLLTILYLMVSIIIFFVISKKKRDWIWDEYVNTIHPLAIVVVICCLLWIFILPIVSFWWLLEKIYSKFNN